MTFHVINCVKTCQREQVINVSQRFLYNKMPCELYNGGEKLEKNNFFFKDFVVSSTNSTK